LTRTVLSHLLFFTDPATTGVYPLSLHDALPICGGAFDGQGRTQAADDALGQLAGLFAAVSGTGLADGGGVLLHGSGSFRAWGSGDRKSTRLNSSHRTISYAVFCLKKKKNKQEVL